MWVVTGKDKKLPQNVSVPALPWAVRSKRTCRVLQESCLSEQLQDSPFAQKSSGGAGAGSKEFTGWGPLNSAGEFPCSKSEKPQGDIYVVLNSFRIYTAMPPSRSAEQRHSKAQFHADIQSCWMHGCFLTQAGVKMSNHGTLTPVETISALPPTPRLGSELWVGAMRKLQKDLLFLVVCSPIKTLV